ncbi:hypothetical protein WI80_28140 [Burkholderia ubonensis]|nr:hypothetical protein WI80_28140 [Burkholderia ubonensis]KVU17071.1 hypothetical protein WK63_11800 [Burkholderia ubonensis]
MHGRSIARRVAAVRRAPSKGAAAARTRRRSAASRGCARREKKFRDGLSYGAASSVYSAP